MIIDAKEIVGRCKDGIEYSKGYILQNNGNVLSLIAKKVSDTALRFESDVSDDSGYFYHAGIMVETDDCGFYSKNHIGCGICECQNAPTDKKLCKHLAAMALEINECMDAWEINEIFEYYEPGEIYVVYDERIPESRGETSKELLDIISEIELQDRNRFCREVSQGNVDIEVTLQIRPDSERITLKIGKTQMYVVKNIRELVNNIKQQNYVRYGKNLEFLHSQSAFSKETLPFISFLLSLQFSEENHFYGYWNSRDNRELELSAVMLDSLMDLYCGKSINVDCSARNKVYLTKVKDADPSLPVKIEKDISENHVKIEFPKIILLEGVRYLYVYWKDVIYRCSKEYSNKMYSILRTMAINHLENERDRVTYFMASYKPQCILELSKKDYSSFVSTLLPLLKEYTRLTVKDIDFSRYAPSEVKFEIYLDMTSTLR